MMVNNNLLPQITDCPKCLGWAVLRSKNGQATCPTCAGFSQTLQIGRHRLSLRLPAIVPYGFIKRRRITNQVRNLFFIAIVFLTFVVIYQLLLLSDQIGLSLSETFIPVDKYAESTNLATFFWILMLFNFWAIYLFAIKQTPIHYLSELNDDKEPKNKEGIIDGLIYFSDEANKLIGNALENVQRQGKTILTREILFQEILNDPKTSLLLARLEILPQQFIENVKEYFDRPEAESIAAGNIIISPVARKILLDSVLEADTMGFDYVDVEDIFLAFLQDPGAVGNTLTDLDLTYDKVKAVAFWINEQHENVRQWAFWRRKGRRRPKGTGNRAWTSLPTPFLDRYSRDLTKMASYGLLPVVRVRDKEIKSTLTILSRTQKNNALLVGEPGVGKTTIVGALAERVMVEDVPAPLRDKRLVALDLGALASGQGSAEQNLQKIISEVERAGNVILYIGHVEALVGTTRGSFNAGAILADALGRGRFQVIASATPADRHRYVESNQTLSSLFQTVDVPEVSEPDAIRILEEEAPKIEGRQKVMLTYPAIAMAVKLSHRLIQDKVLPDKAIEVIDQAATLAAAEKSNWVTDDYVIRVMKERTNVPIETVTAEESSKLMNMEATLKQRIIGQEEAVKSIVEALKRARVGLKDEKRPIGSFLFVGPTGVGKTETAKALAANYFGDEDAMIRLDMSEYQDPQAVYRLIGPSPKSGEFIDGGSLTTPIREKPFSLILLDEFEKAHADVLTIFLQLFDDGRLTENTGRTVSFANTIVIATSNAGTKEVSQMIQQGLTIQNIQDKLLNILKDYFRPELLNRFDKIVVFKPMDKIMLLTIAQNMVAAIANNLKEKQEINLQVPPEVISYLSEKGFDPVFGARPLRRVMQDKLEATLANILLQQTIKKGDTIKVTLDMVE